MDCPKCGEANQDGRDECSSCGVIFSRWQPRQPRIPITRPRAADPDPKRAGVPWLLLAGAAVIVVFGVMWTMHRRAARGSANLDDQLNAINAKAIERQRRQRATEPKSAAPVRYPAPLPPELESAARFALERCAWFSEPISFEVPKEFKKASYQEMVRKDPMIGALVRLHFIALDPSLANAMPDDTIEARLTTQVRGAMQVTEGSDWYRFDVGRRRLGELRANTNPTDSRMLVGFDWTFENAIADELTDLKGRSGYGTLYTEGSAWKVAEASALPAHQRVCP